MEKPITDEIAGIEKDIFHDYIGKTILNPDKVLKSESAGKGIELYEDLLREAKVGSALQTRKLAVVGKEWEVLPATEKRQDVKIAEYVKEVLKSINYDGYRMAALSGIVLGFKPAEIMWGYSEGDVYIEKIIPRASKRFVFDKDHKLRLLTISNMIEGEELPDRKFQVFVNPSDNGSPYGDGLGRLLYWPVWFKKNAIKFWMIFAEKFGSPTTIGKYPQGTSKEQQDALLAALEAIQQETAIKIPDNMAIEYLEAQRAGTVNTYESLCDYMDRQIAQIILGQTLSSEIGSSGSYAAARIHEEVRKDYIKADADNLCEAENNQLIRWIVDYNFPPPDRRHGYPKVWIRYEEEKDTKPLAERDEILARMGVPIPLSYIYQTYAIPEPKKGEEIVGGREEVLQAVRKLGSAEGETSDFSAKFEQYPDQQTLDDAIDSITPEQLQEQMEGILKPIIDLINESGDHNAVMEKLIETYPDMDTKAIEEMLARAIFVSELWGRLNANK